MRFRSAHLLLRNRLAYMAARENSPSHHRCQIVPVKRPSTPEFRRVQCSGQVDGETTSPTESRALTVTVPPAATCNEPCHRRGLRRGRAASSGSGSVDGQCSGCSRCSEVRVAAGSQPFHPSQKEVESGARTRSAGVVLTRIRMPSQHACKHVEIWTASAAKEAATGG